MSTTTVRERAERWLEAYGRDEVELTEDALEALLRDVYRDALDQTPRDIIEALRFCADPETYFAIGFFPDAGCGQQQQPLSLSFSTITCHTREKTS